ncbi:MAG: gliding motility-associated C-terminal domain-containing protein [Mucilaginibacter polytrichastri]|nr:gliding motility-associated C-terminal domain-containing protein [Mucilaginibacter polytrichastri]
MNCNDPVRIACTDYTITQLFPGFNRQQAEGTCLEDIAKNPQVFYSYLTWTAEGNEDLNFMITPYGAKDDVDWGLFELAPGQSCTNIGASTVVRCSSAGGCANTQTGMRTGEADLSEGPGCENGQNGFVRNYTMKSGYRYVLLVLNVSSDLGFNIKFPPSQTFLNADFSAMQAFPAKTVSPYTVQFVNGTLGADEYSWDFDDGTNSMDQHPTHTFTYTRTDGRPQYFYVTLTAKKTDVDCAPAIRKGPIVLLPPRTIFVPNSFTPNGDGVNDELAMTLPDLRRYHLQIFNRYGAKIFETRSIFDNWKGLANNSPAPAGVYFYLIEGVNADGSPVRQSGSVALIR